MFPTIIWTKSYTLNRLSVFNSIRKSIPLLSGILSYFVPGIEVITWMGEQSRQSWSHSLALPTSIYTHHSVWPSKLFCSPHAVLTAYSHQPFMSSMNNTVRMHLISASKHYLGKSLFPLTDCHKWKWCHIACTDLSACLHVQEYSVSLHFK